jgi:hypothetical protein
LKGRRFLLAAEKLIGRAEKCQGTTLVVPQVADKPAALKGHDFSRAVRVAKKHAGF